MLMWDIFSDSLCSLEILNYLKYLIKHMKLNESFLKQLNNNFMFMIKRGMLTDSLKMWICSRRYRMFLYDVAHCILCKSYVLWWV